MQSALPLYDRIGGRYAIGRRPDRRIAARIEQDMLDLGYRVIVAT